MKKMKGVSKMRTYNIGDQEAILIYRYVNQGIDITTKYRHEMYYKHYEDEYDFNLGEYDNLTDLIDDLSYDFIEWVKDEWFKRQSE